MPAKKKRRQRSPAKIGTGRKPGKRPVPADIEILDVAGAAQALGFSTKYIRQLAREGKLPGTKFGNTWRFLRSDLRSTISGGGQLGSVEKVLKARGLRITKPK